MKNNFCQYNKPIFTSLSPNIEKDDILLALKLLLRPWIWESKNPYTQNRTIVQNWVYLLEQKFKEYLGTKHAFTFNSGRTAFLAILKCLNFEPGSEVLIQGFTCNAVVNPILATRLKPIFVDIDEKTLNMDANDLEKKISDKSRVVVVQHTFGLPANINKILEICQQHNLILIEDCAHALGAKYNGRPAGTFGKAAFFSFGRDKVISSVAGGMAATDDDQLAQKLKEFQQNLSYPSSFWIFRELLHPLLTNFLVIPLYGFYGLGKWVLIFLLKTGILSKSVRDKEKDGEMPSGSQKRMPEPLAILALNQLKKLNKFLEHQKQIASFYEQNIKNPGFLLPPDIPGRIYMRYPLLAKNLETDKILNKARRKKIFLDDGWRKTVITPPDTNQEKMGYRAGDCPVAEKVAENILNLPTHINISQEKARRIVCFIKSILK